MDPKKMTKGCDGNLKKQPSGNSEELSGALEQLSVLGRPAQFKALLLIFSAPHLQRYPESEMLFWAWESCTEVVAPS